MKSGFWKGFWDALKSSQLKVGGAHATGFGVLALTLIVLVSMFLK